MKLRVSDVVIAELRKPAASRSMLMQVLRGIYQEGQQGLQRLKHLSQQNAGEGARLVESVVATLARLDGVIRAFERAFT